MLGWFSSVAVQHDDALNFASIEGNGPVVIHFQRSSLHVFGGAVRQQRDEKQSTKDRSLYRQTATLLDLDFSPGVDIAKMR